MKVHVFHLHEDGPSDEDLGDDSNCSVAQIWNLPNISFYNMWDFLVFDENIKAHVRNLLIIQEDCSFTTKYFL